VILALEARRLDQQSRRHGLPASGETFNPVGALRDSIVVQSSDE
jgi:hypothetical protein